MKQQSCTIGFFLSTCNTFMLMRVHSICTDQVCNVLVFLMMLPHFLGHCLSHAHKAVHRSEAFRHSTLSYIHNIGVPTLISWALAMCSIIASTHQHYHANRNHQDWVNINLASESSKHCCQQWPLSWYAVPK